MSMTENNTHAEIIAQVRIHAQMNIDAEKDKRELGILSVEGAIANDFADELEAAHKREVDALQAQIDELTQKIPQPDPAWSEICEKCHDGEEPPDCEYFGEPNGCNSPIYGEHPRTQHANAAKLREALMGLIDGICFHCDMSGDCKGVPCEKMQKAKAALATPARNCDVGTAEDKVERFGEYCISHKATLPLPDRCRRCRIRGEMHVHKCIFEWGQMPHNESEVSHGNA